MYNIEDDSDDILKKYRTEINFNELQIFLNKSSKVKSKTKKHTVYYFSIENQYKWIYYLRKVVERLLEEIAMNDSKNQMNLIKSDIEFSQGSCKFAIPKSLSKLTKNAMLTNCTFCQDDSSYFVCSYEIQTLKSKETDSVQFDSTLLIVWNINDPVTPHK